MTSNTTAEYSKSDSAKKSNVLIPIENQYQDDLEDDSSDEEPVFLYGYRGRHVPSTAGDGTTGCLVRAPNLKNVKTADNQPNGEKAEGENANEGTKGGQ